MLNVLSSTHDNIAQDVTLRSARQGFEKVAKINYEQLLAIATQGLADVGTFILSKPADNNIFKIAYTLRAMPTHCTPSGHEQYQIDFDNNLVLPGYVSCARRDRTTGRRMFANRILTGMGLGFKKLELNAGAQTGAYIWARAGVQLDTIHSIDLSCRLQKRLSVLEGAIDDDALDHAFNVAALRAPDDLKKLAALSTLVPRASEYFDRAVHMNTDRPITTWQTLRTNKFVTCNALPLGKFLLFAERYKAHVDFTNAGQIADISRYTNVPLPILGQR